MKLWLMCSVVLCLCGMIFLPNTADLNNKPRWMQVVIKIIAANFLIALMVFIFSMFLE